METRDIFKQIIGLKEKYADLTSDSALTERAKVAKPSYENVD